MPSSGNTGRGPGSHSNIVQGETTSSVADFPGLSSCEVCLTLLFLSGALWTKIVRLLAVPIKKRKSFLTPPSLSLHYFIPSSFFRLLSSLSLVPFPIFLSTFLYSSLSPQHNSVCNEEALRTKSSPSWLFLGGFFLEEHTLQQIFMERFQGRPPTSEENERRGMT